VPLQFLTLSALVLPLVVGLAVMNSAGEDGALVGLLEKGASLLGPLSAILALVALWNRLSIVGAICVGTYAASLAARYRVTQGQASDLALTYYYVAMLLKLAVIPALLRPDLGLRLGFRPFMRRSGPADAHSIS
jgi:hypothetical protein